MWHQLQNTKPKKKLLVIHLIYSFVNYGNNAVTSKRKKISKNMLSLVKGVKLMAPAGQATDSTQRRLKEN